MRKFVFRLETALRLRTRRLEQEEAKLRTLFERRETLKREAEAMQRERSETLQFISGAAPADVRDLRALAGYTLGWQARAANLRKSTEENQRAIEEQSRRVIAAQRQQKILTNLREKHSAEWRHEIDKSLQAEAEEAWLNRWGGRNQRIPN